MERNRLIDALRKMQVETGSLVCLGCGHEHNCGVHGCAIIREAVEQAVAANGGNRAQAARQLGISRTTLWRYMNKEGAGPGAE